MANPLITQGVLNRVRASIVWAAFPALNITAPYLGKEGVRLALEGNTTVYLPTMTGAVLSQEPYMMITLTATLLKPQALSDAYKQQMENNSALGPCTVYPDEVGGLGVYPLYNCSISGVRELNFSGEDAGFVLSFRGYYLVNADLFN